jgi:hypothetical protein
MGNVFTDAMGKIASNVTQSVISALIVTAVTTYIIVSPGKKDDGKDAAAKDSAKTGTTVVPMEKSAVVGETARSVQQPTDSSAPMTMETNNGMSSPGGIKTVALPAAEKKAPSNRTESPVTNAASKAYKELPPENPTEQKLESTITQGRAKGDSLLKANPQKDKAKEITKEEKKETKDVKKRADEVFDELDQEIQK